MKLILINGLKLSGKTTIIYAYNKKTKHKDTVIKGGFSDTMALNEIQDRIESIEQMDDYYGFMAGHKHNVDLAVLLYCKPSALEKRFKLNHEPDLVGDLNFEEHQNVIKRYFVAVEYPNSLIIDTTNKTIEQCVNLIIKHLGD